jgi:hypothetical protein
MLELTDEISIDLDVLSGRPNPRWTLADDRIRDVQDLLRDLTEGESTEPPGLG